MEKLQADYELLQNTKGKPEQFGLGKMPPDASNVVSLDLQLTRKFLGSVEEGIYVATGSPKRRSIVKNIGASSLGIEQSSAKS